MTCNEFLERIYSQVRPGMKVSKPRSVSRIIDISQKGNIYYSIGIKSKKAVTRGDLITIYNALVAGNLTNQTIEEMSGAARPCNVTTIKWIIKELNLATEQPGGTWHRTW